MSSLFEFFLQKMENVLQTMSTTDMLHVEMEVSEEASADLLYLLPDHHYKECSPFGL